MAGQGRRMDRIGSVMIAHGSNYMSSYVKLG